MTIEIRLKYKYRCSKPKGLNKVSYGGNSGKRIHGTPPKGLRKIPRGKTQFR